MPCTYLVQNEGDLPLGRTEEGSLLTVEPWKSRTGKLARRVGMDVSYLSELENGKKEPCLRKMKELAQGLGVPLSRMVRGL